MVPRRSVAEVHVNRHLHMYAKPTNQAAVCRLALTYTPSHMMADICTAEHGLANMQLRPAERLNRGWIVTNAFTRIPEGKALSYFYKPKPLSSFGRFSFHLVLLHKLVLYISGHRSMLKVLHREFSLTLSQGTELCRISKHVC